MDLDLFACDETGMRCIIVEKFPLPRVASFRSDCAREADCSIQKIRS